MIKDIIKHKIIDHPWPLYVDGTLFNGSKISKSSNCNNECFKEHSSSVYICKHNLSYISRNINDTPIIVGQVFLPNKHSSNYLKRNPNFKNRKTSLEAINKWFTELEEKANSLEHVVHQHAKRRFDPFHEFVKWANEINYYSERLIKKEGFEQSSENLKSLFKTSLMLKDSLDTAALYVNPESVSFGRKRETDLYGMIHKIHLVLSHAKSNKSRVKINILGRVKNQHKVYESFKIIPLSLIQNAIKYRKTGDVEIVFEEKGENLDFSVISFGDYLNKSEITKLFNRGYRTEKARQMKVDGNGLGLYALKTVADAHNFNIKVRSIPEGDNYNKPSKNIFTISIH